MDGTQELVASNITTVSIDPGTVGGFCELNTWEVRSCLGTIFASSNCGPYPSNRIIENAYPLGHGIRSGPWEFTRVPEFSITDGSFSAKRVKDQLAGFIQFTSNSINIFF